MHKRNTKVEYATYLKETFPGQIEHSCLVKDVHSLSVGELMDVISILREELYLTNLDLSKFKHLSFLMTRENCTDKTCGLCFWCTVR